MNLSSLPTEWMAALPPWWGPLGLLVLATLAVLALLMIPFAAFGLKGRLDLLEAQLDDLHAELRLLSMRLPDMPEQRPRRVVLEPDDAEEAGPRRAARTGERSQPPRGEERSEPRLRWPAPERR